MSIISIEEIPSRKHMIRVRTDDVGRNEFVYFKDKIPSLAHLEREIKKSKSKESKISAKIKAKFDKVVDDFVKKVK